MKGRLLQYWVTFMECGGNAVKALERARLFPSSRVLCVERNDELDVFSVWHIIGGKDKDA